MLQEFEQKVVKIGRVVFAGTLILAGSIGLSSSQPVLAGGETTNRWPYSYAEPGMRTIKRGNYDIEYIPDIEQIRIASKTKSSGDWWVTTDGAIVGLQEISRKCQLSRIFFLTAWGGQRIVADTSPEDCFIPTENEP